MLQSSMHGIQGLVSGEVGGFPSRLRLPNDGIGSLPRDITRRRPEVGEGDRRRRGGRRRGGSSGALASPDAGGDDVAAAWVALCKAALAFAFALAAAPFRRRRPPPGAGAVAGEGGVEPREAGAGGSSSTSSFAINLPPRVVKVKDAHPPSSLVCRRSFSSSPSIFSQNLKKLAELQENTSFHFSITSFAKDELCSQKALKM